MTAQNIQAVRSRLKEWLKSTVRVDAWDGDYPRSLYAEIGMPVRLVPSNTAIEYPVTRLRFERMGVNTIMGGGIFSYAIVYRFPGELAIANLPIETIEGVAQYLHARALLDLGGCEGIREASPIEEELPVQFAREDTDQSDWLIYLSLAIEVSFSLTEFNIDPDYAKVPDDLGGADRDVNVRIYRSKIDDLPDKNLDNEFIIKARPPTP